MGEAEWKSCPLTHHRIANVRFVIQDALPFQAIQSRQPEMETKKRK